MVSLGWAMHMALELNIGNSPLRYPSHILLALFVFRRRGIISVHPKGGSSRGMGAPTWVVLTLCHR